MISFKVKNFAFTNVKIFFDLSNFHENIFLNLHNSLLLDIFKI